MRMRSAFQITWVLGLLVAGAADVGRAAEVTVPLGVQATLAVRILEYDRALKSWSGGQLTVGVVARRSAAELAQSLNGRDAQGVPIRAVEHAYRDAEGLRSWIERNNVRLLYLAEDIGADTAAALGAAAGRKLPCVVPTRQQFGSGATVGLVVRDGKPHIMVNLSRARAAGMDLDPKLLQLSEVVR